MVLYLNTPNAFGIQTRRSFRGVKGDTLHEVIVQAWLLVGTKALNE